MQKMMQSDEYDGSGLSLFSNPDYEAISDNVQHWDEDVVDLEFRPDDLEKLLSHSKNGSILDYELFKKTDQVDSFLRQELNSIYQNATTTSSRLAETPATPSLSSLPAGVFNSNGSKLDTSDTVTSVFQLQNSSAKFANLPEDTDVSGSRSAELDDFVHYISSPSSLRRRGRTTIMGVG